MLWFCSLLILSLLEPLHTSGSLVTWSHAILYNIFALVHAHLREQWWQNAGEQPSLSSVLDKSKIFSKELIKIKICSKLIQRKGLHWLKNFASICSSSYATRMHDERQQRHKDLLALVWVDVQKSLMFSPLIIQSSQNDATKTCVSDHIIMCLDCMIHWAI